MENENNIEIFSFGFGFKSFESGILIDNENKKGKSKEISNTIEKHDTICDILALNEMIPTSELLSLLEEELNSRWNRYSKELLDKEIILDTSPDDKLIKFLQDCYAEDYIKKINNNYFTRIIKKLSLNKFSFFNFILQRNLTKIENWKQHIPFKAELASELFLNKVENESNKIFQENKKDYIQLIHNKLHDFASQTIFQILLFISMGFSLQRSLALLDESKVKEIATSILTVIHNDVNKKIGFKWKISLQKELKKTKKEFHASFKNQDIYELVEKCFQKFGWDMLEPFAKEQASNLFKKCFQTQIENMIPYWIKEASAKNLIRSINDINYLLPEKLDYSIYSDNYIFGSTPIELTLVKAAHLLLDKNNKFKNRILVIISDGEFDDTSISITEMLKQDNVLVLCCLVYNKSIIGSLKEKLSNEIPENARRMTRLSSKVESDHEIIKVLEANNIILPDGHMLCIQINHSEILQSVFRSLLGDDYMRLKSI